MNPLRSLLVHLDAGPRNDQRLRVARDLAQRLSAQAQALYAVTPAFAELPYDLAGIAVASHQLQEIDDQRRNAARETWLRETQDGPPVPWSDARAGAFMCMVQQALFADLLVLGQYDPDLRNSAVPPDFVEYVLMASGRPAIVLPYAAVAAPVGRNVLVAWNDSPQSAHALSAALPLLQAAKQVHVATWGADEAPLADPPLDLAGYLAQHGVRAEIRRHGAAGRDIGELILSLAADLQADLLVMGCYGHRRARELVLGGASRTVLRSMTLPVLMAH